MTTKILIDAYDLSRFRGKSIGIYKYTRHVLAALSKIAPASMELQVLCSRENEADLIAGQRKLTPVVVGEGCFSKTEKLDWDLRGCGKFIRNRIHDVDVYFNPRGFLPLGVQPLVKRTMVTIHDMIPLYYSDKVSGIFLLENRFICHRLKKTIIQSDHVVSISKYSSLEITKLTGRRDVLTAYNGISLPEYKQHAHQQARTHILTMASTLHHKNLAGVVKGYVTYAERCRATGKPHLPLVICGISTLDGLVSLVPVALREDIRLCKGISDAELENLYIQARAFVFLSFIEGFGLPPLEALVHGTPTVVSDIPVFREILGDWVRYAHPSDPDDFARALDAALDDPTPIDTAALVENLSRTYSWETHASKLLDLFQLPQH